MAQQRCYLQLHINLENLQLSESKPCTQVTLSNLSDSMFSRKHYCVTWEWVFIY